MITIATTERQSKIKRYAMSAFVGICVLQAIFPGIGWNAISLYSTPIINEWGISRTEFMLSITLVATCNTIISLFVYGPLYQKIGMRKLIISGGVLCCLGYLGFGFCWDIATLYASAITFGIGCALVNTKAGYMVCQKWFKRNVSTLQGITAACNTGMGIIAATLVSFLMLSFGWRQSLYVIAGVFIVFMVVVFILYKGDPEDLGLEPYDSGEAEKEQKAVKSAIVYKTGMSYTGALKTGRMWILLVVMFLLGVVAYSLLANFALLMSDFGFEELAGTALSVTLLGSAVVTIFIGRIMDVKGSALAVALCFAAIVLASLIMLAGSVSLVMAYVVALLIGAGYSMCNVAPGAIAREAFGTRDFAQKMSLIYGIMCLGIAFGPTIMSLFYDLGGGTYTTYFIISSIVAVVLAVAMFPLTRNKNLTDEPEPAAATAVA